MFNHKRSWFLSVLMMGFTLPVTLYANVLKPIGNVYSIGETDFLSFIDKRLNRLAEQGELRHWQQIVQQRVTYHVLNPTPVAGLTTTPHTRTFYVDPSQILTHAITDLNGHVFVSKGTRINPFDYITWHEQLLFINGFDPRQIKWAKAQLTSANNVTRRIKIVLVAGNVKHVTQALNTRIYFDQKGRLSERFHLKHVPCRVQQAGKRLLVKEYALE